MFVNGTRLAKPMAHPFVLVEVANALLLQETFSIFLSVCLSLQLMASVCRKRLTYHLLRVLNGKEFAFQN